MKCEVMAPRSRPPTSDDRTLQQALGAVIRETRKASLNQDDFADRVGVYRSHMGLIEQGRLDLRLSTLQAVAAALDLPLSRLLALAEERRAAAQDTAG